MPTIDVKPTNRKPGQKPEAANEPFKRALTGCARAMSRHPELEVAFSADKPGLINGPDGAKARLPEPPRKPNAREAAILRGMADSMSLRLACHNETIHRRHVPQNPAARALFDAVEQARVEAIGARRMEGRRHQSDRHARRPLSQEPRGRRARPRRGAAGGRRRHDGARAADRPAAAARREAYCRPLAAAIEDKAGPELDKLEGSLEDQRAFAKAVHKRACLARHGQRLRGRGRRARRQGRRGQFPRPARRRRRRGRGARVRGIRWRWSRSEDSADELEEGAMEAADAPSAEFPEDSDAGESEEASENRPAPPAARTGAAPTTRPSRRNSTRSSTPRIFATPRNCSACATISTSSCRTCRAWSRGSPTVCSGG